MKRKKSLIAGIIVIVIIALAFMGYNIVFVGYPV